MRKQIETRQREKPRIRFLHSPQRRHMRHYARDVLKAPKLGVYSFPELFFEGVYTKKTGKTIFSSKKQRYIALQGHVRRPASVMVRFRDAKTLGNRPKANNYDLQVLEHHLKKYRVVFLKPTTIKGVEGNLIVRLQKKAHAITLTTHDEGILARLNKHFEKRAKLDADHNCIEIPTSQRNPAIAALRESIEVGKISGDHIAEAEIKMPLYKGRKWEIMHFVQSPDGKPAVMARNSKIGKLGSILSNISQGGRRENPEIVITQIYQKIHGQLRPEEIRKLTQEFLAAAEKEAIKATEAINENIRARLPNHVIGIPLSELYVREARVDITAELNKRTRRLEPVVIEFQYPSFGGIEEIEKLDSAAHGIFKATRRHMEETGAAFLRKCFRKAT